MTTHEKIAAGLRSALAKVNAGNLSAAEKITLLHEAMRPFAECVKDLSIKDLEEWWYLVMIDRLVSDRLVLDKHMRILIAEELCRIKFLTPAERRKARRQSRAEFLRMSKAWFVASGMTAGEAEKRLAEHEGVSIEALRKRLQRSGSQGD
jgi:hypothetical protein